MITIVVATDRNGVIGREDRVPWRLRNDLIMLRELTKGHTVILGRKTYESMDGYYNRSGRPMPGKTYIVVSRNPDYQPTRSGVRVAHSIDAAIALAKELGDEEVFAIGGGGVFAEVLPRTDRIYLTEVHTDVEGDAHFPALDKTQWREISREAHQKDEKNEYDYDTLVLERA
jgi:dihydrofolate reductase